MKKLLQISIVVITALFTSCSGNDGDPGPAGSDGAQGAKGDKGDKGDPGASGDVLLKSGFISGTISGTRRDMTTFQEAFNYEYLGEADAFSNDGLLSVARQTEDLSRTGYIYLQLQFTEKNNATLPISLKYLDFDFLKELSPSQLFAFNATMSTADPTDPTTVEYPLSIENNDEYQFDYTRAFHTTSDGIVYYAAFTDDDSFLFYTLDNKVVHYENDGDVVGSYTKVALMKVTDAAGNEIDPGVFAGTHLYFKNVGHGSYIEDGDGNDLSGQETWDFSEIVSNYHYNASTGIATFEYSIDIPAPLNSSGRVATLSGNVEAKIYDEVLSRIAGND